MSEQSYESFQFERQVPFNSDYEGTSQDSYSFAFQGAKLAVRQGPQLWQRVFLALISFALWAGMLLCVVLAWDYSWSHDLGYTRIILVAVAFLITLYFIFVNILFNRKLLKQFVQRL